MTTIACNRECMAGDTRITGGGAICHTQKIYRIGKSLFGFAGDATLAMLIFKWLETKRDPEVLHKLIPADHRNDVDILELSTEGISFWNGWGVPMPLRDDYYAIGSGSMAAMSSMLRGEPPELAVRGVPPLDECTGGEVQVELLKVPKRRG